MIEVVKAKLSPNETRIAEAHIKYFGLTLICDICLYKNESLWIRMPELWVTPESKKRFV